MTKYNNTYTCVPFGVTNTGSSCYFNSLLQCLLSCTSLIEASLQCKPINKITESFRQIVEASRKLDKSSASPIDMFAHKLWRDIITMSNSRKDQVRMSSGQEDAHEGFMMFIESVEKITNVKLLCEHRYNITIVCKDCNDIVVNSKEVGTCFEVSPNVFSAGNNDINSILYRSDNVISGFKCPKCGSTCDKVRSENLKMIPEILPIVLKKYAAKSLITFPEYLYFGSKLDVGKQLQYKLVAQSEHFGSMNGGHYWAQALRSDGWYIINDSSYQKINSFQPTDNTYMLFYHYVGTA